MVSDSTFRLHRFIQLSYVSFQLKDNSPLYSIYAYVCISIETQVSQLKTNSFCVCACVLFHLLLVVLFCCYWLFVVYCFDSAFIINIFFQYSFHSIVFVTLHISWKHDGRVCMCIHNCSNGQQQQEISAERILMCTRVLCIRTHTGSTSTTCIHTCTLLDRVN